MRAHSITKLDRATSYLRAFAFICGFNVPVVISCCAFPASLSPPSGARIRRFIRKFAFLAARIRAFIVFGAIFLPPTRILPNVYRPLMHARFRVSRFMFRVSHRPRHPIPDTPMPNSPTPLSAIQFPIVISLLLRSIPVANASYDLVIVGSGPGGYVAAVRAGQLGKTVACVERTELGGICLNWGCIPTKTLIHDAHMFQQILGYAKDFGLTVDQTKLQWNKVVQRSRNVAGQLSKGIEFLFKKNKITSYKGSAYIPQAGTIQVKNDKGEVTDTLTAKNILICTGARNRDLPNLKPDGKTVLTSREAMVLTDIPKSMIIIGAGAIGVEFAYIYSEFGTKVTLIEMLPAILPIEDEEVSRKLEAIFKKKGTIEVRTRTRTEKVELTGTGAKVTVTNLINHEQSVLEAEKVLVAIGVTGNVEGIFGPAATPEIERGAIKVGKDFQTSVKGIYAAGDVIGPPWLAHVASMEATIAVERMFNVNQREMDYTLIPGCTYCHPQVASVGLTEQQCREKGLDYEVGKYNFAANGKALAINAPEGFVKLIFDKKYGELLGAHMLGAEVTDMLAELVLAKRLEATKEEIYTTIHAHPTLSEAVMDAAAAAEGAGSH